MWSHRRPAVHQMSEGCQIVFIDFRVLRQQIDHRGNKACVADAFLLDGGTEIVDAEFRNRDLAGAHRSAGENERKINDMEQRRGVKMNVAIPIRQAGSQVQNVRKNILTRYNGALGTARGAAGIDQRKDSFGFVTRFRASVLSLIQRPLIEH